MALRVTIASAAERSAKLPGPPARRLKLGKPGWRPRSASAAGSDQRNPRFSAYLAKVDPYLVVPGYVLDRAPIHGFHLVFHTARDEVRAAVAVPVRHTNAGGLPGVVVGDKQLWPAELRRPLRADV